MKVLPLTPKLEPKFWAKVKQDPLDHYFFIFDWATKRQQTQIFVALDNEDEIEGLMVVYLGNLITVRGSQEAVKQLLGQIEQEHFELNAPLNCMEQVSERFSRPAVAEVMDLMTLHSGEEKVLTSIKPKPLAAKDAEAVANLMREAYPAHWGEATKDDLISKWGDAVWLGIWEGTDLASIGIAEVNSAGSHILFVATRQQSRNRGYATSIVSSLTQKLLKQKDTAIIHVIDWNTAAKHTYEKIGYKPIKQYLYIKT